MFMHKIQLRNLFNKSSAVILSLLILISIITPLCVGMSNASAVSGAKFHPNNTYYFYLGDAPESFVESAASGDVTARFVSGTGEVIAAANLAKSANNTGVSTSISQYVYSVTMPTNYNGKTTTDADAVYIRDLGVIPSTLTASPQNHVRLIFDAEQVDDLANPGFVTFDKPLISARDSRGNALTISDNGTQIITPYDPDNGAYGAQMSDYVLTGDGASKSDYWWYVDIPENQFAQIASVTFYSETSTKNGVQSGAVVTQELEPIRYGDFVFFRGTIPVDPHIYKFEASDPSFTDTVAGGKYQNYFIVTEDSEMTVSKYTYPERFSSVPYRDVWVYNESWAGLGTVYATGDYNDPLNGTTDFTEDPAGSGWFKGSIPEGAAFRFHPQENDDEKGASAITEYPKDKDLSTPAYYMSNDYTDQWIEKSNTDEVYDYYATRGEGFDRSDIYAVKATYYDYLSNQEMANGWRNNLPSIWDEGSNNNSWGNGESFANQFSQFNDAVADKAKTSSYKWRYPLFFGNFAHDDDYNQFQHEEWLRGYYNQANSLGLAVNDFTKFWVVNNSQRLNNANAVVQGLMYPILTPNYYGVVGDSEFTYDIKAGNSGTLNAPYFDAEWLTDESREPTGGGSTQTTTTYKIEVTKAVRNYYYNNNRLFYEVKIPDVFDTIIINNNGNNISSNLSLSGLVGKVMGYWNNSGGSGIYDLSGDQLNNCPIGKSSHGSDGYYYIMFMDETYGSSFFNIYAWNSSDGDNVNNTYPGMQVKEGASQTVTVTTGSSSTPYSGRLGYVVSSYFPFRTVTNSSGVTHYVFNADSTGARGNADVVNFTWDASGKPTAVNYYYNENQIRNGYHDGNSHKGGDGGSYYPDNDTTGSYGYYPFNTQNNSTQQLAAEGYDYGTGTKMEMTFRLPANGKYTTSTGGTENAKFTFTGDDDLWVFIDGQLVLDMGGAHSMATGSIDFGYATNKIRATVEYVGLTTNIDNGNSDSSVSVQQNVYKDVTIDNTDITKVHTMTIYYMERGLLDSNLAIDFSTMPANTAVRVEKNVESSVLNDGFDVYTDENGETISGYASRHDTFDYTITRGTSSSSISGSTSGFKYSRTDNVDLDISGNAKVTSGTVTTSNGFTLKDNQYVRFLNQFYANDYIMVIEADDTTNTFNYTTQVDVYDSSGRTITANKYDNNRQVDFLLDGTGKDTATAIVEYTNIPETTDLVISTEILDEDRNPVNRDARRFTYQLQVYVEGQWRNVPFDADIYLYTLDSDGTSVVPMTSGSDRVYYETLVSENGTFSLSKYNKLVIHGLPVGMQYRITATRDVLYAPAGYYEGRNNTCDKDPTGVAQQTYGNGYQTAVFELASKTGTVETPEQGIANANQVQLINVFSPAGATVSAKKLLDGALYSGEAGKFQFKAELVGGHITGLAGGGERDLTSADAETYKFNSTTVGVSATGTITWSSASDTFDYLGDYIYKLTEENGGDSTYTYDTSTVYYALVQNNGDGDPVVTYYKTYTGSGGASGLSNKIASPESLTDGVVFRNNTNIAYTDVSFTKQDASGNPLAGVEFTLYTDANCTTAGTKGTVIGGSVVSTKTDGTTFTNPATSATGTGLVTFSGLDYQPSTSEPNNVVATYYIKETKTVSGYQLDPNVYQVDIKANGTYTITGMTNTAGSYTVKNNPQPELPKTGGIGVGIYYVFGAVILMIGILAFICYKKRESYLRFK